MYGNQTEVTKNNKVVLPVRAALQEAVSNNSGSSLRSRVKKELRRNSGIIFRRQWWNSVSHKQVTSKDWSNDMRNRIKAEKIAARQEVANAS
jgi:hypothetical protein